MRTAEEQENISDLADKYIDEAINNGAVFSEELSNWAFNKAITELFSI